MPIIFWSITAIVLAIYIGLFLLRTGVALRPPRLGVLLLAAVVLRLVFVLFGYTLCLWEGLFVAGVTLMGLLLLWPRRVYVMHVDDATLREQIETACAGLFLGCSEPAPNRYELTAKGNTCILHVRPIAARVQLVIMPVVTEPSKQRLFVQWLAKQYPGPVPRIHIVLKKE